MRLGKVYYNLEESEYETEYKRFRFVFSSKFYIMKFERELLNYVKNETDRLNKRYGSFLQSDEYLAYSLYKKIEKRGFLVYFNDVAIKPNETFTISLSFLK